MADAEHDLVVRAEACSAIGARRVAAMLDLPGDGLIDGEVLPRGWHFILLGAETRRANMRADGFPGLGAPMPDLGLPRLLLAGRKVQYVRDIRLGSRVERTTVLTNISEKRTASGRRAVATIQHDIRDTEASAPAVVEVQTYLLLEGDTRSRPSDNGPGALPKFAHAITMAPDETLLFQYSALCFNSHKIHLDRQWARDVEGFPDLVVNGGVTTLLLTEFARRELGLTLSAIEMKNLAPLFCDRTITLGAEPHGVRWRLTVWDDLGRLAAEMEAEVQ